MMREGTGTAVRVEGHCFWRVESRVGVLGLAYDLSSFGPRDMDNLPTRNSVGDDSKIHPRAALPDSDPRRT